MSPRQSSLRFLFLVSYLHNKKLSYSIKISKLFLFILITYLFTSSSALSHQGSGPGPGPCDFLYASSTAAESACRLNGAVGCFDTHLWHGDDYGYGNTINASGGDARSWTRSSVKCGISNKQHIYDGDNPGCIPGYNEDPVTGLCKPQPTIGYNKNKGQTCDAGETGKGNPINSATGNKFQQETDITNSIGLNFSRHYNSVAEDQLGGFSIDAEWTFDYFQKLEVNSTTVDVFRPNGRELRFTCPTGTGNCTGDADLKITLDKTATGYSILTETNSIEDYDSSGTLLTITLINGNILSTSYNGSLLASITDTYSRSLSFAYDGNDRLETVSDPDGHVYTYTYDNDGNLDSVTYPDATPGDNSDNPTRTYQYNDSNYDDLLTGIVDENGNTFASWGYDNQGRAIYSEHAGGADRVDFTYNGDGTTTVTDSLGATNTLTFDITELVPRISNVTGGQCGSGCSDQGQAHTFDANGFLASRTDFESNITTYINNSRGLETSRTEASGTVDARTITTKWHTTLRLPTKITDNDKETTFTYNTAGQVLTRTEKDLTTSNTRTTTFTYDSNGNVLTIDGPRTDIDDTTTFTYDVSGNRASMSVDPDGAGSVPAQVTNYTSYDNSGRLLSMTDPNGVVTTQTYDARGRLITRTVAGAITTFDYDNVGNVTKITLPNGSYLAYTYDAAQRLTNIEDNAGNKISYTLDDLGNRTKEDVHDPSSTLRRTQSRTFDNLSRMTQNMGGANQLTVFGYDGNGNQTSVLDPLSRNSTSEYDALNRLIKTTDPDSFNTQYAYDDRDNLTSVTDARNNITSYTYDKLDNLTQLNSPDTGITNYTYDDAGNRLTQTDARAITTTYAYDALNRLTSITYPTTSLNVTFTYDQGTNGIGRLTGMTDASGTTTYAYDARGNVTSETKTISGQNYVTSYAYDAADNLTQITYPSGRTIDYDYNNIGQVIQVNTTQGSNTNIIAIDIQYHPFGPIQSMTLGNGLTTNNTFDQDYRLTDAVTSNNVSSLAFSLDLANNITAITNNNDSTRNQSFNYDNLDRLTSGTGIYGTYSYTYDALGNRLTESIGGITDTYSYAAGSNQLQTITGGQLATFTHDAIGNITIAGGDTFTINDANRMATANASASATYTYNGKGERVKKVSGSTTTIYHYDQNGNLIAESDDLGVATQEYVYLNGQRLAMIDPSGTGSSSSLEVVTDNTDANDTSAEGLWTPTVTGTGDYEGSNVWKSNQNTADIIVDNEDGGYSNVGDWQYRTNSVGFYNISWLWHAKNGVAPDATVVDDLDSGASSVGSWSFPSNGDPYQFSAAGTGADVFTWSLGLTGSKEYEIFANWVEHHNRATDAPYTINHVSGSSVKEVNQKINGGEWRKIGTETLDSNSTITLSDDANQYVIADQVMVVPTDSIGNYSEWAPSFSAAGTYEVYAWWVDHSNRATDAPYIIYHDNGETTVHVNQKNNGGQWNLLGTFDFTPGQGHMVRLTDQANGYVVADAIKFVPISVSNNKFIWNAPIGSFDVYAKWTQDPSHSSDATYTLNHASGQTIVTVNQQDSGTGWNLLGSVTFDEDGNVELVPGTSGEVVADAIKFVSTTSGTNDVYYIHSNHLDTPQVITDSSKTVVWSADYDPFGSANVTVNTLTNNLRFPGQYFDSESGLHYNYFRDYNPSIGRYMQSDPIGLQGGLNTYSYVGLNPIRYFDLYGLEVWDVDGIAGAEGKRYKPKGNGNLTNKFTPQDFVCTPPAHAFDINECTKQCCVDHDNCYELYGCNATSWWGSLNGWSGVCQVCNSEAERCFNNAFNNDCPARNCE